MGLADIVRSGIAIANTITASLQVPISIQRWTGQGQTGAPSYAAAITVQALVEPEKVLRPSGTGGVMALTSKVTILTPLTAHGATGRSEPLDQRDKITLSDGTTCPISTIGGVVTDPSTNLPYMFEVTLVR